MQSTLPIHLGTAQDLRHIPRTVSGKIAGVLAATGLMAICAHVSLPLYFTPVPLTLQTMAVLLIGLALGPVLGASAMVLYLVEGASGLPVFSPHGLGGVGQLLGPTGGFLLSYPLAAAAAGGIVRVIRVGSRFAAALVAGVAASVIIFAMGAGWLGHLAHLAPAAAWHLAVAPFLAGEVLKVSAAAAVYSALHRWLRS